jgi:hypothetical protein
MKYIISGLIVMLAQFFVVLPLNLPKFELQIILSIFAAAYIFCGIQAIRIGRNVVAYVAASFFFILALLAVFLVFFANISG